MQIPLNMWFRKEIFGILEFWFLTSVFKLNGKFWSPEILGLELVSFHKLRN